MFACDETVKCDLENYRLGVLAALFADGVVRIGAVPRPVAGKMATPFEWHAELRLPHSEMAVCFDWSHDNAHRYIAVGGANGGLFVFDVQRGHDSTLRQVPQKNDQRHKTDAPVLCRCVDHSVSLPACVDNGSVQSVAWSKADDEPHILAALAHFRSVLVFDVRRPLAPLFSLTIGGRVCIGIASVGTFKR